MKKNYLLALLIFISTLSYGQVRVLEDFDVSMTPTGWTNSLNSGTLISRQTTVNSYGRAGVVAAVRANNYNVGSGNRARLETNSFTSSVSGDSLSLDVAHRAYPLYTDSLIIHAFNGTSFVRLIGWGSSQVLDTITGITTGTPSTASFTPTSTQWCRKTIALPIGTTQIRFEFFSNFGNLIWIDNIVIATPSAPVGVITGTKSNLTSSSVTLAATIPGSFPSVTNSGVVIGTSPGPVKGSAIDSASNPLVASGSFTVDVTGLSTATTYYYRSYAVNAIGITYGPDSTFTTNSSAVLASINRNVATNVQVTTATIGGTIINNGGDPITMSGVVYDINPMPAKYTSAIDSVTTPNVALGSFSINPTGLTHSTKYYYRAYAINSVGIAYSAQDSFTTAPIVSTLPYSQNFDGTGNTGWTSAATGGINEWIVGTPAKTQLSGAFSGTKCWFTSAAANYSNNGNAAVVSPQFDFTALTVDPVVRFRHNFKTESGWDAAVLEISINGGVWTQLDNTLGTGVDFNTVNSSSWYNNSSTSGPIAPSKWSENSNLFSTKVGNWIRSTTKLTGAAGQGNVKFRLRFGSDASGTDEGWAFDDIEVFAPVAPTMATGTKTNLTNNSVTLAGTIVSNGNSAVTASGVVIGTGPGPVKGSAIDSATNPLVANGSFTVNVAGLSAATTYYYRSYAVNGVNTSYGPDSTFTTNASAVLASINRNVATNVQATTATIGGTIINNGGDPITISGVVYDTLSLPTRFSSAVDSATTPNIASGTFSFNISGLVHSKKYYYRAYAVNSVGTAYSTQDSFTTPPIISTFPYSQNFDGAGNTGWASSAIGTGVNDWQLGTPAKTNINAAYSAPNAWVTKLTGNYSNNSYSGLVSPQFNFTTMTADPVLRFRHKFRFVQTAIDGAIIEISINGGAWTQLDNTVGTGTNFNTTNSTSWYSANTAFWNSLTGAMFANNSTSYATQSNGWIQSTVRLTGAAGQSNVKVRMTFNSTTVTFFGVEEGWAIDDIEVFPPTAPIMATGTKTNLTNNSVTLAGTIVSNGNSTVTASGVVIGTGPGPVKGSAIDSATNPLVVNGSFTVNVAGLSAATTYYYRSYAINAIGTSYGPDSTFTTNASATLASINRNIASNIQTTTATIGGTILSDGGDPITISGVVYDINPMPAKYTSAIDSVTTPNVALGTFNINPAGLTHSTKYYYRAYAINSVGIAYSAQDSFTTSPIISTLPYSQNFDGVGNTGWTSVATGGINEWIVGTPAKTQLSGAFSGTKCWFTSAAANYVDNSNAAVVSPIFDFTGVTSDPVVRFRHNFKTEAGWDAAVLEISINNGAWTKLDNNLGTATNFNTLTSYSWYNSSSTSGPMTPPKWSQNSNLFSSNASNWIQTATRLTGAAGQSNVKFRIRFASDASGTDEGWAFDNVEVVNDVTPTTPTGTVTLTPNGTSVNVAFVPGNGQGRLVVARLTSATAVVPYDTVLYTANAVYGSGTLVGAGNYVVYNGTGSSVNVTGLTTVTGYSFDVYEYNGKYMHNKFAAASSNSTTTLPVKLVSFTANNVEGNVQLKWITANEINNKGFEVERSVDGKNFKSIDFVKGAGNTNKTTNYSKIDLGAFVATSSNVLYYRLKQVDFDGTPTYSNQVVVNENELVSNGVKIYPNPFSKSLTVDISSDVNTNTTIAITDISGKVISTTLVPVSIGNNTTTLPNLDLLTAGIYFVKVSNGTKAEVFKVVKY